MYVSLMLERKDLDPKPFYIDGRGDLVVTLKEGWVSIGNDCLGSLRNAVLTPAQRSCLKSAGLM